MKDTFSVHNLFSPFSRSKPQANLFPLHSFFVKFWSPFKWVHFQRSFFRINDPELSSFSIILGACTRRSINAHSTNYCKTKARIQYKYFTLLFCPKLTWQTGLPPGEATFQTPLKPQIHSEDGRHFQKFLNVHSTEV